MGRNGVPDRWLNYSPMGSVVPETRFIACKVPLKDALLRRVAENERFGPNHLMEAYPKLGLLVDLTNTQRYYSKEEFTRKRIKYEKIFCPGQVVPPNSIVKRFFEAVDQFLEESKGCESLIVVHCTHGVNRTGYFICRYMIEKLNIAPEKAVERFQQARGHNIERQPYVDDLKSGCKGGSEADLNPRFCSNRREERIKKRKIQIRNNHSESSQREIINNHRKKRLIDSSQSDCLNLYNWRARNNCASDQYCDDLSRMPPQYKKLNDMGRMKNEYHDTILGKQDDLKSAPLHSAPRFSSFPPQYKKVNDMGRVKNEYHDTILKKRDDLKSALLPSPPIFSSLPPQYQKVNDMGRMKNEYHDTILEKRNDLKSASLHSSPRFSNLQSVYTNLKSLSYPNEYPKPLLCQQKPEDSTEIHQSQSVKTDLETMKSNQDYYKAKQSDYYRELYNHVNHFKQNSPIHHDVAGLKIFEPSDVATHSARHRMNSNSTEQGPSCGQNYRLRNPIENFSPRVPALRPNNPSPMVPQHASRPNNTSPMVPQHALRPNNPSPMVPQHALRPNNTSPRVPQHVLRPNNPQPYYPHTNQYYPGPSLNTSGVRSSNMSVLRPRSHFRNRAWQRPEKPITNPTQQPQNSVR